MGTTAQSIEFADGRVFSADLTPTPLLTVSAPIGLQFGSNPAPITSQGATLALTGAFVLAGGDIDQIGGTIKSNGNRIDLGSVQQAGVVSLGPDWSLSYDNIQKFGDIRLAQAAVLSADGVGSGAMQLQGNRISVTQPRKLRVAVLPIKAVVLWSLVAVVCQLIPNVGLTIALGVMCGIKRD